MGGRGKKRGENWRLESVWFTRDQIGYERADLYWIGLGLIGLAWVRLGVTVLVWIGLDVIGLG